MRRVSLWLLAVSVGLGAVAAAGGAGCSSSSAPATEPDASEEAASDASGVMICRVDASLSVFAESDASAAGCALCVGEQCLTAITTCATDCTCINLFTCLADSGVATVGLNMVGEAVRACAGGAGTALLDNPGVRGVADCLQGVCATACSAVLDAGTEAGATLPVDDDATSTSDANADASVDADAGSTADADDSG
jgi:hypothetical protein